MTNNESFFFKNGLFIFPNLTQALEKVINKSEKESLAESTNSERGRKNQKEDTVMNKTKEEG